MCNGIELWLQNCLNSPPDKEDSVTFILWPPSSVRQSLKIHLYKKSRSKYLSVLQTKSQFPYEKKRTKVF